jgi:hypothetical protein
VDGGAWQAMSVPFATVVTAMAAYHELEVTSVPSACRAALQVPHMEGSSVRWFEPASCVGTVLLRPTPSVTSSSLFASFAFELRCHTSRRFGSSLCSSSPPSATSPRHHHWPPLCPVSIPCVL